MKKIAIILIFLFNQAIFSKTVTIGEKDYQRLFDIADEYINKLATKSKIQMKFEKLDDRTIKVYLVLAAGLRFADDFKYATRIKFSSKIEKIELKNNRITVELETSKNYLASTQKFLYYSYGVMSSIVIYSIYKFFTNKQ